MSIIAKIIDLIGQRFGRLVVLKIGEDKYTSGGNKIKTLDCICDCGNKTNVRYSSLMSNRTLSCGCLFAEKCKNTSHKKKNVYDLSGDYGIGYTSEGEKFYFDLEDYDKIKDYYWRKKSDGYIISFLYIDKNTKKQLVMHRMITNCSNPDFYVDHINHKKNDNRKYNLRVVTPQQNNMNNSLRTDNTSNVTGVFWNKTNKKWQAQIRVNKKNIYLGCYNNFEDAVNVRKQAEEKYFGEYSYDNSIKKVGGIDGR